MIVPRGRLLVWTGIIVVPGCALAALSAETARIAFTLLGGFTTVVLIDCIGSLLQRRGVGISFPPLIRATRFVASGIAVGVSYRGRRPLPLRIGLLFPRSFVSSPAGLELRCSPGAEAQEIIWPFTPLQRGAFPLPLCVTEIPSVFGLFGFRERYALKGEIRVYPNLHSDYHALAAYFLSREAADTHVRRQVGKGREFEKLREWVQGDSFNDIHWKATARRNRPITKVFQIERTQQIYVVMDVSRFSQQTSPYLARTVPGPHPGEKGELLQQNLLERYIAAALLLGRAAQRQGDCYGLLTFGDRVGRFVRASRGPGHYAGYRDALYTLVCQPGSPDFGAVMSQIRLTIRHRALIVVLTHLDDPVMAQDYIRAVDLIRRQHLVVTAVIRPPEVCPLFSRPAADDDDLYQHLGDHHVWHTLENVRSQLRSKGVPLLPLDDEHLCSQLIADYLRIKQRQLI